MRLTTSLCPIISTAVLLALNTHQVKELSLFPASWVIFTLTALQDKRSDKSRRHGALPSWPSSVPGDTKNLISTWLAPPRTIYKCAYAHCAGTVVRQASLTVSPCMSSRLGIPMPRSSSHWATDTLFGILRHVPTSGRYTLGTSDTSVRVTSPSCSTPCEMPIILSMQEGSPPGSSSSNPRI